jgi:hypothetical protein
MEILDEIQGIEFGAKMVQAQLEVKKRSCGRKEKHVRKKKGRRVRLEVQ